MRRSRLLAAAVFLVLGLSAQAQSSAPFRAGVNLTGWFQSEHLLSLPISTFTSKYFSDIKSLGIDVVRLPVSFLTLVGPGPEYRVDSLLFSLLDQALDDLTKAGLSVVVDNHSDFVPRDHEAFLTAIWTQFARHNLGRPASILYEIQNEPHDISAADWDRIQRRVLSAIRKVDSQRTIVVTGADWGGVSGLLALPPYSDAHLIYSFHFYDPFLFTHQGADWAQLEGLKGVAFPPKADRPPDLDPSLATSWVPGALREYQATDPLLSMAASLDSMQQFSRERKAPVWCGEFGVYNRYASPADRLAWYRVVNQLLDDRQIPWTMWDYRGGFGLFNQGGEEAFASDLNLGLVTALGFHPPAQPSSGNKTAPSDLTLFDDQVGGGLSLNTWDPQGHLSLFDRDRPAQGRFCIRLQVLARYESLTWNLGRSWRLLPFTERGVLSFWARTASPQVRFDVRFLDLDEVENQQLPWRRSATVDKQILPPDGQWHHIEIPLAQLKETGAWNGAWHEPVPGSFRWDRVSQFQIVAEDIDLSDVVLGFDDLKVAREATERP